MIYAVLVIIIIFLLYKLIAIYSSLNSILEDIDDSINKDINISFRLNTFDRHVMKFAGRLEGLVNDLKKQRHKYTRGDEELKTAIINISHDLRTPLTAIKGYVDLIKREELSSKIKEYLSIISERTQAMTLLTEELFKYSIILGAEDEDYSEEINVNEVLEDCIAGLYGALKGRDITPVIDICTEKVKIKGNKSALTRSFSNIVSNAIKYSDGDLIIKMKKDGEIIFENAAKNLDSIQTEKLFDRFYTVDTARKSTGLGLSIAKKYIERMNGTINAKYKDGRLAIIIKFK
ncbi:MAG: HAMP domain-containing histidine kinase [Lachnospiraceae bacterium]|nr:HAMP domain-containing histidine kinase [Lachnospiraceae bacterium]